jgi:aminopeptidase-like protein
LVTPSGLAGGYAALRQAIGSLEANCVPRAVFPCEPQLGRRELYPTLSKKGSNKEIEAMMNLLAYADGRRSLLDITEIIGLPIWELRPICDRLAACGVLQTRPYRIERTP